MSATATTAISGDLRALFAPRGIAVVGASRHPHKLGATLVRSLSGFEAAGGRLALVNGRDDTMYGTVAQAAAGGPVDLAMICVPAAACADALAEAAAAGARAAVIYAGGFAETGEEGAAHQRRLAEVVTRTGIRVLGPNTSGFLAPHAGLTATFVPGAAQVRPGTVAVVAASGGVNHALAFLLAEAGHGVSLAVGMGNAVDVGAPDILDHLAGDPATAAVALHVESVADGPRLVAAVSRLAAHRPVVALVVGRNDVGAFAASHTGALATSWRVTRAALAQAGAVLVDDERELVDAVGALAVTRLAPRASSGVGVVTAQAGPGLLLLDDLRGRRSAVPELTVATRDRLAELLPPLTYQRNPVDTGRPGPGLGRVLATVAADPGVDVIAAYTLHEPDAVDIVDAVRQGRTPEVPMVVGLGGTGEEVARRRKALLEAGVAVSAEPRGVAAATAALLADARARAVAAGSRPRDGRVPEDVTGRVRGGVTGQVPEDVTGRVPEGVTGRHDEHQAKELLSRLGVATMPRRACRDRAGARAAFAELGGPVAVKLLDAGVLHKTDVGGVHLGITGQDGLEAALDRLDAAGARHYLVERMAPPGVDLIVGARRDPVFGPVVLVGLGGTVAEALSDVAVRLAPLSPVQAASMPSELAGHALLAGWRGGPVLDVDELSQVVVALGDLLDANPLLDEIEINPLRLTADGLVALDAVIIPREADDAQPHL
ncbi:CoA-binding protein [Nonomuraea phyllanthi]|uniref:acetate--CoA ligase family protein n=1 Tax=Nonomuraea phyllanthi TaxID=2219224 RepID=UPI0012936C1B|nr:acetate--CoA ligase family protein [Nonomuraea phyllanthi]QFY13012.1 CoA-binding protein [Nonomuraea phyllanthi]